MNYKEWTEYLYDVAPWRVWSTEASVIPDEAYDILITTGTVAAKIGENVEWLDTNKLYKEEEKPKMETKYKQLKNITGKALAKYDPCATDFEIFLEKFGWNNIVSVEEAMEYAEDWDKEPTKWRSTDPLWHSWKKFLLQHDFIKEIKVDPDDEKKYRMGSKFIIGEENNIYIMAVVKWGVIKLIDINTGYRYSDYKFKTGERYSLNQLREIFDTNIKPIEVEIKEKEDIVRVATEAELYIREHQNRIAQRDANAAMDTDTVVNNYMSCSRY